MTSSQPYARNDATRAGAETQAGGRAFVFFCALTFVVIARPQDYIVALIPLRLAMVMTVTTALVTVFSLRSTAAGSIFRERETKLYLVFYAAMIAGIAFSVYRPGSFDAVVTRYIVNVCFFLLFVTHVNTVGRLETIASLLLVGIAAFTIVGLTQGQFVNGRYDTGSQMYDPNDVAFVEVSLLPFALWVIVGRFSRTMKLIAIGSVLSGSLLILFTASRGGLLGLATFLALFMCLRVHRVSRRFKFLLFIALVTVVATNARRINVDRFRTLETVEDDYNFQEGGRADIWQRGVKLFLERPVTGVGVSGFGKAIGDMRAEEFGTIPRWQTAHSSYVLVLTETGLSGCIPFLLLITTSLITFNGLRRRRSQTFDVDFGAFPGLLLMGFAAQLVAAAFLSQTYSVFFTLTFALSATLNRLVRVETAPPASALPEAAISSPYARFAVHPRTR